MHARLSFKKIVDGIRTVTRWDWEASELYRIKGGGVNRILRNCVLDDFSNVPEHSFKKRKRWN